MKLLHQSAIKWIGFVLFGIAFLGSFLDSISNAITLIIAPLTYIGTAVLLSAWILTELGLMLFGVPWKRGNRTVRVKSLNTKIRLSLIGILILLWIPRLGDIPTNKADIPLLSINLINPSDAELQVMRRGEFVLWLPTAFYDGAPRVGGRFQLIINGENEYADAPIIIPAQSNKEIKVRILGQEQFLRYLERGDTDLTIMIRTNKGLSDSPAMPFSRDALSSRFLEWQIEK